MLRWIEWKHSKDRIGPVESAGLLKYGINRVTPIGKDGPLSNRGASWLLSARPSFFLLGGFVRLFYSLPFSLIVFFIIILNMVGTVEGIFEGMDRGIMEKPCPHFGDKRWHYIVPTYPLTCVAGKWLDNNPVVYREDRNR